MFNQKPKSSDRYRWTMHIGRKMQYYGLTPSRVLRIVRAPERTEDGVADGTIAGMQKSGTKAKPNEIWAMWRYEAPKSLLNKKTVIITAWRYPGVSPVRGKAPIPSEILAELELGGEL